MLLTFALPLLGAHVTYSTDPSEFTQDGFVRARPDDAYSFNGTAAAVSTAEGDPRVDAPLSRKFCLNDGAPDLTVRGDDSERTLDMILGAHDRDFSSSTGLGTNYSIAPEVTRQRVQGPMAYVQARNVSNPTKSKSSMIHDKAPQGKRG